MSKFIKGTSILGVLALGFGVWQLTKIDQQESVDVQASSNEGQQSYATVIIDQTEPEEMEVSTIEEFVDDTTLQSIQENEEMKQLIYGLGRSVEEDLKKDQIDTEEEWKTLEKDTKEKQLMIKELLEITNHDDLKRLASKAFNNLEQTIQNRQLAYYKEAVASFKALSDQL